MKLNRMKFAVLAVLLFALAFLTAGCGSSGSGTAPEATDTGIDGTDDGSSDGSAEGDEETPATPSILSLSLSQTTVKSDNSNSTTIAATVLDAGRAVIEGIKVTFSANAGQIDTSSADTDGDGKARVVFSSGTADPSNQVATITAAVAGLEQVQIPIQIVGSTLTAITDNNTITDDGETTTAKLTITAMNAGGTNQYNTPIELSVVPSELSANGPGNATLSAASGSTDVNGQLEVTVTGITAGELIVRAEGLGTKIETAYSVSPVETTLSITSPTPDATTGIFSLDTNSDQIITVNAPGQTNVRFATTLGTLTGSLETGQVITELVTGGTASVVLRSALAGVATIQVFDADASRPAAAYTLTVAVSAPSMEAAQIALQASSAVVAPSTRDVVNTVDLIVTVKNSSNQVVEGAPVAFSIENPTGGGETISPVIVYTDDQGGTATAVFTSGSLSSGALGVRVRATVVNTGSTVTDTIDIVIGGTAGSVVIGEGTIISSISDDTVYQLPMSVLVADSNGNAVSGAVVSLNAWPGAYATGVWVEIEDGVCEPIGDRVEQPNEDLNKDLIMDPVEDSNGDGELTPSNSAAGTLPAPVTTDENGVAQFQLTYRKASATWIKTEVTATVRVLGTETQSTYPFWLPYTEGDSCLLSDSPYNQATSIPGPSAALSLIATPENLTADGVNTSTIEATVTDANGDVVADGETVTFAITGSGTLSSHTATTMDGIALVIYTASYTDEIVTLSAETANGTSNTVDLTLNPALVGSLYLSTGAVSITADGSSQMLITAEVRDTNGRIIADGKSVSFSTTAGDMDSTQNETQSTYSAETINGVATAMLTSTTIVGSATIIAATDGVSRDISIIFTPGPVAVITLTTTPNNLTADGSSTSTIRALVTDINDNAVADGETITFILTGTGLLSSLTATTSNGIATITYTAPSATGAVSISAKATNGVTAQR